MVATRFSEHLLTGDHASRPAFGSVPEGTLYACSDHDLIYQSDGVSAWSTWADVSGAGGGIPATIFDAKGDIIAASAADTAARLAASGTNDLILAAASGEATGLQWQGRSKFKYLTRVGNGNYTTTSTSFVAIDGTNLGFLTFVLAIGDVVRCTLACTFSGTGTGGFDFLVDRPTSADVYVSGGREYGLMAPRSPDREACTVVGMFVATEAGTHGFEPVWRMESGTGTIGNATSGTSNAMITYIAEKLGPVTA